MRTAPANGTIIRRQRAVVARDSIFVNILHYASSSIFQKLLGVFTALARPKLLSPELFGLWSVLNVLPNYASYLHLGSRSSMRFLIPVYETRGEEEKISATKAAVYRGTLLPTLLFALVLLLSALFLDLQIEMRIGLAAIALVVLFNWRFDYLIGVLKSHQEFRLISRSNYVTASAHAVFTISLIYLFGFYGALLSLLLTVIVGIVYLQRLRRFRTPGRFQYQVFRTLVQMGFPILAYNLVSELIRTSDRFVILFLLGQQAVGYYGIAIMVLGFAISIPAISREVVEPRLMQNLDRAGLAQNLDLFMTRPLMNSAYLMPFVIGSGILLAPVVIPWLLPDYAPAVDATRILLLGGYFLAASHVMRGVVVALELQLRAALLACAVLLLNILLSITLVLWGYGAEGVALASSVTFFLLFVMLFALVWWRLRDRDIGLTKGLSWFFLPFPVMCILIYLPDYLLAGLQQSPLLISIKLLLFLVLQGLLFHLVRSGGHVSFRIES